MNLGFNMAGTESVFEEMLNMAPSEYGLNYMEIGIAEGTTFLAVAKHFQDRKEKLSMIGLELPDSPFFDIKKFFFFSMSELDMDVLVGYPRTLDFELGSMLVSLHRPGHLYGYISFLLIDGCHGGACVKRDFLQFESKVRPGGIVAFHDACEPEQGTHFQSHCGEGIAVRRALLELGILDGTRKGWAIIREVQGDKSRGGHGFVFVQKL